MFIIDILHFSTTLWYNIYANSGTSLILEANWGKTEKF
jgi:hypothetical protein